MDLIGVWEKRGGGRVLGQREIEIFVYVLFLFFIIVGE